MAGIIIGIMGQARAGKDTIAAYLAKTHGFTRIGLADPMKRFCQDIFRFSDEQVWGEEKETPDPRYVRWLKDAEITSSEETQEFLTPRFALQTLGTEWGRNCYRNVWIDYGLSTAKTLLDGTGFHYTGKRGLYSISHVMDFRVEPRPIPGVAFSDLRFRNEFDAVKAAGGILARVKRPAMENNQVGVEGHASEEEQKNIPDSEFHLIFNNDREGDFDFLYNQVEKGLFG